MAGYTVQCDSDITSKAIGKEMPISPKHSKEICSMLRGMDVNDALEALDAVIELKRAVPLRRYNKRVSHKPGVGPGRYPQKAAGAIKGVIESAMGNAEYKGLDPDGMRIMAISASRGRVSRGYMARAHGRSTSWDQDTVNIEVILEEME